jgi:hypothetical protein
MQMKNMDTNFSVMSVLDFCVKKTSTRFHTNYGSGSFHLVRHRKISRHANDSSESNE